MLLDNKFLLKAKGALRQRVPFVFVLGSRIAANTVLFRDERSYLKGGLEPTSELPSVLFFTCIRSASQYLDGIIARLYAAAGGTVLNLPKFYFHARPSSAGDLREASRAAEIFRPGGFYYGALRPIEGEIDLSAYRSVVVVRDPRDIMVSFFYSLAYAHTPSDAKFIADAKEARELGIEWFVRQPERLEMVGSTLEAYRDTLWGKDGVFSWKYEDMMDSFGEFMTALEAHVTDGRGASEVDAIVAENAAKSKPPTDSENLLSHRRSGRSGAFRDKLEPDTADFLTEHFGDLLDFYGYER